MHPPARSLSAATLQPAAPSTPFDPRTVTSGVLVRTVETSGPTSAPPALSEVKGRAAKSLAAFRFITSAAAKQDCQSDPSSYKMICKTPSFSVFAKAECGNNSSSIGSSGADGSERKSCRNYRGILCTRATFLLAGSQSNTTLFVAPRPRAESSHGDPRENELKPQSSDRPLRTQWCLDTFLLLSFLFFFFFCLPACFGERT